MHYKNYVVTAMEALRASCDTAESMMPHEAWPFPSYTDILMSVQ